MKILMCKTCNLRLAADPKGGPLKLAIHACSNGWGYPN